MVQGMIVLGSAHVLAVDEARDRLQREERRRGQHRLEEDEGGLLRPGGVRSSLAARGSVRARRRAGASEERKARTGRGEEERRTFLISAGSTLKRCPICDTTSMTLRT